MAKCVRKVCFFEFAGFDLVELHSILDFKRFWTLWTTRTDRKFKNVLKANSDTFRTDINLF